MRVISGSARGLKLKAPEGLTTRPTTDRIKESLFNIIAADIYDCRFLDLFSGSGAIAIEALSRGAKGAVLVDADFKSIKVINDNLKAARVSDRAEVIKSSCVLAINKLSLRKDKFDIIFMDPPYNKNFVNDTLNAIVKGDILSDDGFIICEMAIDDEIEPIKGLEISRIKDYKITKMTFLVRESHKGVD
ncbi:MAG: 16S rRNA (guanine(966)-N(2))-methyltransferase RsmD [Lachnospirales bacterium]